MERDLALDARWDSLLALAQAAWCWRDSETIAALELQVKIVGAETRVDWDE